MGGDLVLAYLYEKQAVPKNGLLFSVWGYYCFCSCSYFFEVWGLHSNRLCFIEPSALGIEHVGFAADDLFAGDFVAVFIHIEPGVIVPCVIVNPAVCHYVAGGVEVALVVGGRPQAKSTTVSARASSFFMMISPDCEMDKLLLLFYHIYITIAAHTPLGFSVRQFIFLVCY